MQAAVNMVKMVWEMITTAAYYIPIPAPNTVKEIQMKRYVDQFTGWQPGCVAFVPDTADVDTINRIRGGRAAPIDMREHEKLRAAVIADYFITASMQKST